MKVKTPNFQIFGNAKVLRSKLLSTYSQRESDNIMRMLVEYVAEKPYHHILMEPETLYTSSQMDIWMEFSRRLLEGEPIQYILQKTWFGELEIEIGPGVLIPRPETEELVDWIVKKIKTQNPTPSILDIGTGSGCIPLFLKYNLAGASICGVDISEVALAMAKNNSQRLKLEVEWQLLDVLKALPSTFQGLDVLVSNPPYIPEQERLLMSERVRRHEPEGALFVPDEQPLLFYEKIAQLGLHWLKPGGCLCFEIHESFGSEMSALLTGLGYERVEIVMDMQEKDRIAVGYKNEA